MKTDQPKIHTLRELHEHTSQIVEDINTTGQTALITHRGRLLALITPLAMQQPPVESVVIGKVMDSLFLDHGVSHEDKDIMVPNGTEDPQHMVMEKCSNCQGYGDTPEDGACADCSGWGYLLTKFST